MRLRRNVPESQPNTTSKPEAPIVPEDYLCAVCGGRWSGRWETMRTGDTTRAVKPIYEGGYIAEWYRLTYELEDGKSHRTEHPADHRTEGAYSRVYRCRCTIGNIRSDRIARAPDWLWNRELAKIEEAKRK